MGGDDIIISRGDENDVIVLGDDGATIMIDPLAGPNQQVNELSDGRDVIRIMKQATDPS